MSASAAGQKTRITAVFLVAVDTVSTVALQFKNKQTEAETPFLFAIDAVFTVALHYLFFFFFFLFFFFLDDFFYLFPFLVKVSK